MAGNGSRIKVYLAPGIRISILAPRTYRPPFGYVDNERAARTLGDDIAVVPQCFQPNLNRPLGHPDIPRDRVYSPVKCARFPVGVNDQVKKEPHRTPHNFVMFGGTAHNEAAPNISPPLKWRRRWLEPS